MLFSEFFGLLNHDRTQSYRTGFDNHQCGRGFLRLPDDWRSLGVPTLDEQQLTEKDKVVQSALLFQQTLGTCSRDELSTGQRSALTASEEFLTQYFTQATVELNQRS